MIISISGLSQVRKDYFNFISAFNWSLSEDEFKLRYSNRIVPDTDSLVLSIGLEKGYYLLNDLKLGEFDCLTFVSYNQEGGPIVFARLDEETMQASMPSVMTAKLDRIFEQKLLQPDMTLDDVDLSGYGYSDFGEVKGKIRVWLTDATHITTICASTENGLRYLCAARKGTPREPDFRKGKWGDSMAACKSKEGKRDEYGMENIYAFDTYVAGIEATAAYRFTNDMLTSGKYIFSGQNTDNCISNYDNLVSYLTKKYGEPIDIKKEYSAQDYEKRLYSDGELIREGKLKMNTIWVTPFSYIIIALDGEKYHISLVLEYYSSKLDKVREDSILSDL